LKWESFRCIRKRKVKSEKEEREERGFQEMITSSEIRGIEESKIYHHQTVYRISHKGKWTEIFDSLSA
jgi:hypothetical protein